MPNPNILVLMADQHRPDALGGVTPAVQTPNLEGLAAEGVRFERAYCQGPLCMPARASFLTERYVRDHGVLDNRRGLPAETPTFLHRLREAGYHTACIGKMHLYPYHPSIGDMRDRAPFLESLGFDETHETGGKGASANMGSEFADVLRERGRFEDYRDWYCSLRGRPRWATAPFSPPLEDYLDVWLGERTVRWLEEYDLDRPWFLWVGFGGPHNPWDAPAAYTTRYQAAALPIGSSRRPDVDPETPFGAYMQARLRGSDTETLTEDAARTMRAAYYANISLIDEQVGAILEALRRRGVLESTWVVYTSDHGEMAGDHGLLMKRVFYEPAARVPLVVRPPGGMTGQTVDTLVEQVDFGATFREIAGAPALAGSAGRSLLADLTPRPPSLAGKGVPRQTPDASSTISSAHSESSAGADRSGTPFPAREGGRGVRSLAISETLGYGAFITERFKLVADEERGEAVQLFDLVTDPAEEYNLVREATHAAIRDRIMDEHVRPFLRRPMPALPEIAGAMSED